jgi:hypothetical protein
VKDNYYVWAELYETAILETDDERLPSCLEAAKAAINRRLQEIQADRNSPPEELHAIADALNGLKVLRTELEKTRSMNRLQNANHEAAGLASSRLHLCASNCLRRLSWASDVRFSISIGTLKFVAQ